MNFLRPSSGGQLITKPITHNGEIQRELKATVLPSQARQWLDTANTMNRPLSAPRVRQFALDMQEGRWLYTGDPIRFGSDGILIDGQHRLAACVESGIPLVVDIIKGLDPNIQLVIDSYAGRQAAQQLAIKGKRTGESRPNLTSCCAIAQLLIIHERYGIQRLNNPMSKATRAEVISRVQVDPSIAESAHIVCCPAMRQLGPISIAGFCHYIFNRQDPTAAELFFTELKTGENLSRDNPAYLMRERLLQNRMSKAKLMNLDIIALYFRAWIQYRSGKTMKILKAWRRDGPASEAFPEI